MHNQSWPTAAALLGIALDSEALPAVTACPLCHGARLQVYEDLALGPWLRCIDCRFAGMLVDLAARLWDVAPLTALGRLSDGGAMPAYTAEDFELAQTRGILGRRRRLQAIWDKVRGRLPPSSTCHGQWAHLGRVTDEVWTRGASQFLGFAPYETFCPGNEEGLSARMYKTFGTAKNETASAIGFHDAPERLCGMSVRGPQREFFRVADKEGGLAYLGALHHSDAIIDSHVVVMPDPWWALRLHLRHFNSFQRPLPLLAYHDERGCHTHTAWQCLAGRVPVIWDWHCSPASLCQAIVSEGFHSAVGPSQLAKPQIANFMSRPSYDILRLIVKRALPWPEALVAWMERIGSIASAEILPVLHRYGLTQYEIGQRLPLRARHLWAKLLGPAAGLQVVQLGEHQIVENHAGWSIRRGGRRISDTVIRIHKIYEKAGTPHYSGILIRKGQRLAFELQCAQFEAHPIDIIVRLMVAAGRGRPAIDRTWETRLLDLAVLFREPIPAPGASPAASEEPLTIEWASEAK